MKFLAVFAAVLALGCATPAEWTVNDLAAAMQDSNTPVFLQPILEESLNNLMLDIVTGSSQVKKKNNLIRKLAYYHRVPTNNK